MAAKGAKLPDYGFIRYRREGEYHAFNPLMVRAMHAAVKGEGDYEAYKQFSNLVHSRIPMSVRTCWSSAPARRSRSARSSRSRRSAAAS